MTGELAAYLTPKSTWALLAANQIIGILVDKVSFSEEAIDSDTRFEGKLSAIRIKIFLMALLSLLSELNSDSGQNEYTDCENVESAVVHAAETPFVAESHHHGHGTQ